MMLPKKRTLQKRRQKRTYRRYLWLLLPLVGVGVLLLQPQWFFALAVRAKPGALYRVAMSDDAPKMVALTIDDGPSEKTAEILDVLEQHGAKATFFNISSYVEGHESVLTREIEDGHELGNHMSQDEPSVRLGLDAFEADLLKAEAVLLPYVDGEPLRWLRPGMGWYSAEMVAIAQKHGYELALGSLFPYDTHAPSSKFASAFILNRVKSGDVIVLHDGGEGRSSRTIETLQEILPILAARGYQVTTLSELTESAPIEQANLGSEVARF